MVFYAGSVLSPSRNLRNAAVGRVLPKLGISVCDLFSAFLFLLYSVICLLFQYPVRFSIQLKTVINPIHPPPLGLILIQHLVSEPGIRLTLEKW